MWWLFESYAMKEAIPALITRLRGLPIDHAPDGWPAVRMREITALLDHIDTLQSDAARLDWLADPANPLSNVQLPTPCVHANLHSLRAAIDMAMEIKQ